MHDAVPLTVHWLHSIPQRNHPGGIYHKAVNLFTLICDIHVHSIYNPNQLEMLKQTKDVFRCPCSKQWTPDVSILL